MTNDARSLTHTKWQCQYHVVFIRKYSPESALWGDSAAVGGGVPVAGAAT